MKRLLIALVCIFPVALMAQVASPTPTPTPAVVDTLTQIANKIPGSLPVWVVLILGFVFDLVARKWPTKNPTSLLIVISAVLKGVITILGKADKLLNDVIGQNSQNKTPPAPPAA